VILTTVTVLPANDLFQVICSNSENRQFLGGHGNKNLFSTSTMEAEYVGLSTAVKYVLWLKSSLKDLQFPEIPMALFCDNHSAIDLAETHWISELSKHINIHYHCGRELVYNKTLLLMYIQTTDNLANMCTKGLPEVQLSKLCMITLKYNEGGC
jgi:hypothetical protein